MIHKVPTTISIYITDSDDDDDILNMKILRILVLQNQNSLRSEVFW